MECYFPFEASRAVAGAIIVVYLGLLYGVYVPDWDFIPASADSHSEALHVSRSQADTLQKSQDFQISNNIWFWLQQPTIVIPSLTSSS